MLSIYELFQSRNKVRAIARDKNASGFSCGKKRRRDSWSRIYQYQAGTRLGGGRGKHKTGDPGCHLNNSYDVK